MGDKQPLLKEHSSEDFKSPSSPFGIVSWLNSGIPPPATHKKTIYIVLALQFFGIVFLALLYMAYFRVGFYHSNPSYFALLFCEFITMGPGLYYGWGFYNAWRGKRGYRWIDFEYVE